MKIGTKLAILVVAVLITLVGFNLMVSSAVDILKAGDDQITSDQFIKTGAHYFVTVEG